MVWPAADRVIFATIRKFFSPLKLLRTFGLSLAYDNHRGRRMGNTQIDQNLSAALYMLGFNFSNGDLSSGEIAEIKGNMTIKLVHQPGEELKFVVELPGGEQMIFSVDRRQIVKLADHQQ
jgi:hypothetical protein